MLYNLGVNASSSTEDAGVANGYGGKVERAVLALRHMLARGELLPGEHVRQDQLAHRLGTTRVPVREALKTLVAEGLLVHRQNHGHFVATLTSHELHQLCWLRGALEDELARTARWPDADLVAHLRELNDGIRALGPSGAVHDITEIDLALHLAMWRLSDQDVLTGEILRVWRMIGPYRTFMGYTPRMVEKEVVQGHDEIINALERRDRQAYRSSLAEHLKRAYRVVDFLRESEAAAVGGDRPSSTG